MATAKKPEEQGQEEDKSQLREVKPDEEMGEHPEGGKVPISGLAIGGIVSSLVALFLPVIFALFVAIVGIVFGLASLSEIRRGERTGISLAWGAIIIGAAVAGLAIFVMGRFFVEGM